VPRPRNTPAPRASSTGSANNSGARDQGAGTGAGGEGDGTGADRGGSGQGGVAPSGPTVRSGRIDSARDFPIPEGGRAVRDGTSVTVVFTVGTDGRAYDCSVARAGPDPATNALVCPLVVERIRFNPARDSNGNPVPARYAWRQDFFRR
jgi:protein TonB